MRMTAPHSSRIRLISLLIGCIALALATPLPASAQHRAKLSKGLAKQVSDLLEPPPRVAVIMNGAWQQPAMQHMDTPMLRVLQPSVCAA